MKRIIVEVQEQWEDGGYGDMQVVAVTIPLPDAVVRALLNPILKVLKNAADSTIPVTKA